MQIKILTVPIYGGDAMEEVLNVFLRSHRVLQVEQRLVETPGGAAWSFCIRYFGFRGVAFSFLEDDTSGGAV